MNQTKLITAGAAMEFVSSAFTAVGVCGEDAHYMAENMVQAELRGLASHGLSRLSFYIQKLEQGGMRPRPNIVIKSVRAAALSIDCDRAPGVVAGRFAMSRCIKRAKETGVCVATVSNANHYGYAGYYPLMAIKEDMIGMTICNTVPNMHFFGGIDAVLGTNPIAIGIPSDQHAPLLFDAATSNVAQGKVLVALKEGRSIPLGWSIDRDGNPTADPAAVINGGSMEPFGGYKGADIALMIDMLCGALAGSSFSTDARPLTREFDACMDVGFVFAALSVDAFTDSAAFKRRVSAQLERIKASRKAPGVEEIILPGEPEYRKHMEGLAHGFPVGPGILAEMNELAQRKGLKPLA